MTKDELLERVTRITVSRRDGRSALYKPLLLLILLGRVLAEGTKRVSFADVEARLRALIKTYSPGDSPDSIGQPWWHLPTDGLWRVLGEHDEVLRESGTPRGDERVPSFDELRKQQGAFPPDVAALLTRDPGIASAAIEALMDHFFETAAPSLRDQLLADAGGRVVMAPVSLSSLKIGKAAMMERVGAKLTNVRWGWDGVRADGSIVFIGWEDHVVRSSSGDLESCRIFKYDGSYDDSPGGRERALHVEHLIKNSAAGYLVIATPKRADVNPREIRGVDPNLHTVRLERRGDHVYAVPVGFDSAPDTANPRDEQVDVEQILSTPDLPETEKAQLVQARRGQGLFRSRVEMIEQGCRLTGVTDRAHLRAGRIKPWRHSTNAERLDGNNGLLLAPHIDHLFDRGFISFDPNGRLLISPRLHEGVLKAWSINQNADVGTFRSTQEPYLQFHRTNLFLAR